MCSPEKNTMLVCRVRLIWSPVGKRRGLMRVLSSVDASFEQLLNILFSLQKIFKIYLLSPSISTPHSSQSILAGEVMLKGLPMIFVFLMETYPVVVLGTIHPSQQLLFCLWIHLYDSSSRFMPIHLVVFRSARTSCTTSGWPVCPSFRQQEKSGSLIQGVPKKITLLKFLRTSYS